MSLYRLIGSLIARSPWEPPCTAPDGYGCVPAEWLGL